MITAQDLEEVGPGTFVWHSYDPIVRADLFSTALHTGLGTYIVDPIPIDPQLRIQLEANRKVAGIVATNTNHARSAAEFAEFFSVPLFVHPTLAGTTDFPNATAVNNNEIGRDLASIMIDGAPDGEMALFHGEGEGTMVIGDALINFRAAGLEVLPAKYCRNARLMRRSLERLFDYRFERMLFAHGIPILQGARDQLERLLQKR